jgi:LPXTG-motif cell wall-anchored protein
VVEPLPAQAFTFDVAAVNDAGTGPASRKTEPVLVGTPPAAPAAPDRLPARADSTLEPMAPADPGADVDVTSATGVAWPGSEANAALFAAGDDSAGPIPGVTDTLVANADGTITGTVTLPDDLAPGSYILAVSYLNPQGEAQVATGPLVVGQPVGVPAAPTDVAATGGTLTATVTWKAPTDTGDSPITGYTVTTYTQGGAVFGTSQAGARATSLQLTDLAAGTYSFDVRAVNAAGSSAASSRSNTVTVTAPATTPPPATGGGSTGGGSGGSSTTGGTPTGIPGGEGATAPQLAPQAATGTRGLALAGLGMMLAAGLFLVRRRSGPGSIR